MKGFIELTKYTRGNVIPQLIAITQIEAVTLDSSDPMFRICTVHYRNGSEHVHLSPRESYDDVKKLIEEATK